MILTGRPSSPPFLLVSSSQILAPSSACLPLAASGPVSAMEKPILIGSPAGTWALAGVRNRATAAVARNEATTPRRVSRASIASSSWLMRLVARDFLAVLLLLSRRTENCRCCRPRESGGPYSRAGDHGSPLARGRHRARRDIIAPTP